jgi:hypothetical protein
MSEVISFERYLPPERFDDVPWTQARIDEAPSSTGPWTTIDTITFPEVDEDPSEPQPRSFTTPNGTAPDQWYRVTFLDGSGSSTLPTSPVQFTQPTLTAFADHNDLATWLGIDDMTEEEAERADALLADVSNVIREEVDHGDLGLVTDETITMPGTNDESILLPSTPVVSVSEVTLDGTPLVEGTDWYLDGNMIVRRGGLAFLAGIAETFSLSGGFGWPNQTLAITYTHGYAEIPGKVKTICLQMVVRVWTNPGSVARETYGDETITYDSNRFSPTGMQLTDDERRSLKRLFGSTVKSVQVGR